MSLCLEGREGGKETSERACMRRGVTGRGAYAWAKATLLCGDWALVFLCVRGAENETGGMKE